MCELYIELLTTRLVFDPVPTHLLQTLGKTGFDHGLAIKSY